MEKRRCRGVDACRKLDFELKRRPLHGSGRESGIAMRLMTDFNRWR